MGVGGSAATGGAARKQSGYCGGSEQDCCFHSVVERGVRDFAELVPIVSLEA
jgi:hypothetical protein